MKKRHIILCDGTWNNLEMRYITNVGRLAQLLTSEGLSNGEIVPQQIHYDDGVAASDRGLKRMIKGAFGGGLEKNIYQAYRYLAFNYEEGDEIMMFGFSRGAYTVRCVAGMIGRIGLVSRSDLRHMPDAIFAYRSKNAVDRKNFKKMTKSRVVPIDVLGVWDTVGALGIPDKFEWLDLDTEARGRYRFYDNSIGLHIKNALHAVAIDERRKEFNVTLMKKSDKAPPSQVIKQIWFPGDHGCVGGGSWSKRGLSNRCLRWMLDECATIGYPLGVDSSRLSDGMQEDHRIFFQNQERFFYDKQDRILPTNLKELDETALWRYKELPELTQSIKNQRLKNKISQKAKTIKVPQALHVLETKKQLSVGEKVHVRVFAASKHNPSNIEVMKGESYQITVSRTQVWKDGKFDPCDIHGWNLAAKPPWQDERPAHPNFLEEYMINKTSSGKLVKSADWFELVMSFDGKSFKRLKIAKPKDKKDQYKIQIKVTKSGEFFFAANDGSNFIFDNYSDNKGWVWIEVERI